MAGGVAVVPTWIYSHGNSSINNYIGIVQDPLTGEIRQAKPGNPSRVSDIIVPVGRNPSPKGFAVVAWDQEGNQSQPPVEVRL